jgi:uncharacterized membrane protein YfcA
MDWDAKDVLLLALWIIAALYLAFLGLSIWRTARKPHAADASPRPTALSLGTGFVANFFDTLGIGSFATTTAIFRQFKMLRDEWIPGTLNVGHTLPTIAEALIFTKIVPVDTWTLLPMIGSAILGAWLGAGVVAHWSRRRIQIGMGVALLAFVVLLVMKMQNLIPGGGDAVGLTGVKLALGLIGNFVLGALMTLGIGLYAPCLILVTLLGMNPTSGFPIMMGSCAFLMPIATVRFVRAGSFHPGVTLGLLLGGIPGVLLAAYVVKSLPLQYVYYLVIIVVLYTAIGMLRSAWRRDAGGAGPASGAATGG